MTRTGYRRGMSWDTYARISEDPNDLQRGVKRQADDTRAAVAAAEGTVAVEHTENDTSAYRKKRVQVTDTSGNTYDGYRVIRPVWHRALQRLRTGEADALMVYDLDRLARDPRDLEDAIEVVEHYGKSIVSATASEIDLTTESGRMAARLMVVMANKSSADTSRRVKRAALANAMSGKPVGRRAFGWTDDHTQLVDAEAQVVRAATEAIIAGTTTVSAVARDWNEAGIKTARGSHWRNVSVRQYLRHPRLAGYRVYHGNARNEIVKDASGTPVMGQWPPLLDIATWEALQGALTAEPDTRGRVPRKSSRHYLLSGILRCGICNFPMYGNYSRDRGRHYYKCTEYGRQAGGRDGIPKHTQTIQGPDTDEAVSATVLEYLRTQDDVEAPDPTPWPGEGELATAQAKVSELLEAFNTDQLPGSVAFPQISRWEARVTELTSERRSWAAAAHVVPALDGACEEWPSRVEAGDTAWLRGIIEKVVTSVVIRPRTLVGSNQFEYDRIVYVWRAS